MKRDIILFVIVYVILLLLVIYYNKKHTLVKNDNYEMMIVKTVLFLYLLFLVIIKIKLGFVLMIITVVVYCYLQSKKYEKMTINISSDLIKSDVEIKTDESIYDPTDEIINNFSSNDIMDVDNKNLLKSIGVKMMKNETCFTPCNP